MACIIKKPTEKSKGVITFTTQERDKVFAVDRDSLQSLIEMKDRWVVGLHHNWHDYNFRYNPVFDFSMAGPGDLGSSEVPLIPLDACNFIQPPYFSEEPTKKIWDVLYVTRAVYFKRLPVFLNTIRKLYDSGKMYRVLLLCAIPPENMDPANLIEMYQSMFSMEERKLFSIITLEHDYPFTLDHVCLSHFYHSSKVFVHCAPDERRCRVIANAVASKLPVVCSSDCASIIPSEYRKEPFLYTVSHDDYATSIDKSLTEYNIDNFSEGASSMFNPNYTILELKKYLSNYIGSEDMSDENFNFHNLDIRLGRHHQVSYGPNKIDTKIKDLIQFVCSDDFNDNFNSNSMDLERSFT